jgi:hypothetical protein
VENLLDPSPTFWFVILKLIELSNRAIQQLRRNTLLHDLSVDRVGSKAADGG